MRLLNVNTLELKLFAGNQIPAYAILSHTWDEEEITFEDIANESIASESAAARCKSGFSKIKGTCERAAYHGYQWVWIDSCCIDKSSSAELQEAINSMWNWYKNANVCYAYLAGVPNRLSGWSDQFRRSRWFTRGWTLQELIAPWSVEFYAADWSQIGTKLRRLDEIHNITGISKITLKTSNPEYERVAEVMSWAAHRNVTREEDLAYSLMGLFDINMPMLYGEGSTKAFLRLQEEIFKRRPDHSLFLYTYSSAVSSASLLAESPTQFCRSLGAECYCQQIRPG
ncbi:HET-domain-containing protein [Zopfia rhizophila CBS 207.26]|uniref:HET-domain-containing protein n=1 Tax=Zopfia rhizophila CBS 207.26 TaxID=1314779 RepID=A0A6A6E2K0_9PEZI|nr:HET-domain-containing protein [Zopfia rhizophila CBS 207.26]